jgi:signal transduction histidine kinase/ActR/RegA family two-component response regulator
MFNTILNRVMGRYAGADPVMRMKAKFFFLIYLLILAVIPIAIAYSAWTQLHNPVLGYRLNLTVLIPEVLIMLPLVAILVLLLKGRFSLSAHLLLILLFLTIWSIMVVDRSGELSKLDTVVYMLGMLTLTPLAVIRRKHVILLYGAANLIALGLFVFFVRGQLNLPFHRALEYFADNAVAIVFITLSAFTAFLINQRALDQMESELAERRRQQSEKERLQAQLLHAHKLESVGRLAGGVAHDFNNLLTTIMGNADLAMAKLEPKSETGARLKDIMRAAERAAALTRQLLAFSRRQVIEPRPLDLKSHIEKSAGLLERLLGERIQLELILASGVGPIMADPGHIEQILINLTVNARDAMPGGGTITIAMHNQRIVSSPPMASPIMKPGDYVVLSVTDTGAGISEVDLQRIFDPFFTTKPVGQGTGLGLASVYGAVQQNNGSIEVKSCSGEGTVMTVYFPASGRAPRAKAMPDKPNDLPGGDETILIVEDDAMVLDYIQLVLSSLGYRVRTAADGATALSLAALPDAGIDLLLTDVILPDMTGMTLVTQLHRCASRLKVLYMSAHGENVVAQDGAAEAASYFIAKPFTTQALAAKVREVLNADHS